MYVCMWVLACTSSTSTFTAARLKARAFSVATPTVWKSLPDSWQRVATGRRVGPKRVCSVSITLKKNSQTDEARQRPDARQSLLNCRVVSHRNHNRPSFVYLFLDVNPRRTRMGHRLRAGKLSL